MTYPAPLIVGAADRASVRDPRWVVTRLHFACSDASRIGRIFVARFRPSGQHEGYELSALHNGIRRIMDDLTKWGPTGDDFLSGLVASDLPPLTWSPLPTGVGFSGTPDRSLPVAESMCIAERWADLLSLIETPLSARYRGVRRWSGDVEGWRLEVWAIADADQYRLPPWFGGSFRSIEA